MYKMLKFIYSYFVIPLWIFSFFLTTLALVALWINAWISQKIFKRTNQPLFQPRPIFPYTDEYADKY